VAAPDAPAPAAGDHHLVTAVAESRSPPGAERYEVCELEVRGGHPRLRVVATAPTLGGARIAVRTLREEGELANGVVRIRDQAARRWLAA
jgi:hypothetical protein